MVSKRRTTGGAGARKAGAIGLLCVMGLVGVGMGGCAREGGYGYSADQYAYVSRPWEPKTVTLRDTRTGQDFWSVDVPVGKKLVMAFSEAEVEGKKPNPYTPDQLDWTITDEDEDFPRLGNRLLVPGKDARRIDVTLRSTPEMPDGMLPAQRRAEKQAAKAAGEGAGEAAGEKAGEGAGTP